MDVFLLNDLLAFAEELLIAGGTQGDQIERYLDTRSKVFAQTTLKPKNNMRKMMRDRQGKGLLAKKDSYSQVNMYSELEKIYQLKRQETDSLVEGIKWESVQRVQKSEQLYKEYREFTRILFGFIDGVEAGIAVLAGLKSSDYGTIEVKEVNDLEISKTYDEVMEEIKSRQISEVSYLNELKKHFKSIESHFSLYFETVSGIIKTKEMENKRLSESIIENKAKFEEEIRNNLAKIKSFEESLLKSQENKDEKHLKTINKIQEQTAKKEESITRKYNHEIQELIEEKEKITKKLQKALDEFEATNEKQMIFISQLKSEIVQYQGEKNGLMVQIEKNESVIEDLKMAVGDSELARKHLEDQVIVTKEQIKELKNRMECIEEEYNDALKLTENKYQKLFERMKINEKGDKEEIEKIIERLEDEIRVKNSEIQELYGRIQEISDEKYVFYEKYSKKEDELDSLDRKFREFLQDYNLIQESYEKYKKHLKEIEEKSEKTYVLIKKKQRPGVEDCFSEFFSAVLDLVNDKEWLLRKLEDVSRRSGKSDYVSKVNEKDISRSEFDSKFITSSMKSFQTLKSFEKTRSEVFNNIKFKNC